MARRNNIEANAGDLQRNARNDSISARRFLIPDGIAENPGIVVGERFDPGSGSQKASVVLLADIFGSKASLRLALPWLIAADLMSTVQATAILSNSAHCNG